MSMKLGGVAGLTLAAMVASMVLLLGVTLPARAQGSGSSPTPQSSGATITVNTTQDISTNDGKCSLREAITNANNQNATNECAAGSDSGQDTIVFASGVSGGTITLDGDAGRLHITDPKGLFINGGSAGVTISGDNATGVFQADSGSQLTLNKLTVVKGTPNESGTSAVGGGGIINNGTLTITNSTFSQNTTGRRGGAIYSVGQLRVINTTFSGNRANLGGAISSPDNQGTAEVTGSTFSGNSAVNRGNIFGQGGAIENQGALSVINSTFSGNRAGAGGGIASGGTATTINGNTFSAQLFLTNDTFSGNSASLGNGGGGIVSATLGSAKATNTILAKGSAGANCVGTVTDGGFNISSDASCAFSQRTSKNRTNPKLAKTLANNGGPTQTIALLKGSPALNAIPKGASRCAPASPPLTTDQRGVKRPQGKGCDIGAYEKVVRR